MNKILIIGLGLIGGSFAKALRQQKIAKEIWAFDTDIETINLAKKSGAINGFALLDNNLNDFDLIVIATPLAFYKEILQKIAELNPQNSVVIDLGSLKESVLKTLPHNLQKNFVACHPIAGSDKTGFSSSSVDLFSDKKFVICKGKNTAEKSIKIVEDIANKIGAKPDFIDAKLHDEIYALVSHLPQFLSFLTKEFAPKKQENDFIKTAFRLDNSSPELWEDIFKINEKNLEKFYLEFFDNLTDFATKLQNLRYKLSLKWGNYYRKFSNVKTLFL
jgi:prephenate dehydrogenase